MTECSLEHGVTLEFPRSGVSVRPRVGDVRNKARHFTHGNFELSKEDGVEVNTLVEEWEPAIIKFDGTPSYRFVVPPDAVQFKYDLDDLQKAELTLVDARKVLRRGGVTKLWDSTSLENAVEYVVSLATDEFNVIEDIKYTVEEEARQRGERVIGHKNPAVPALGEFQEELESRVRGVVGDLLNLQTDNEETLFSFDFNGESPMEALSQITDEFGVDWWVATDGTLWIGDDATVGQIVGTIADNNGTVLKRYSVTQSGNVTDAVHIEGPYSGVPKHELLRGFSLANSDHLRVIAEANAPTIDGSVMEFENPEKAIKSPSDLEQAAKRALVREIMNDVEGSIQVNGVASENIEGLANLRVGDKFLVDGSIKNECGDMKDRDVITGPFIIQSVHHRFDTGRGWEITTEVARLPDVESIQSRSVLYDPLTDKEYDSFAAYFLSQT